MNAVTLVLGIAGIFTILSLILFLGKVYKKSKLGKVLTTIVACIAVFFVFGACGILPAKQQITSYHNEEIGEFYRQCKKDPNLKSLGIWKIDRYQNTYMWRIFQCLRSETAA